MIIPSIPSLNGHCLCRQPLCIDVRSESGRNWIHSQFPYFAQVLWLGFTYFDLVYFKKRIQFFNCSSVSPVFSAESRFAVGRVFHFFMTHFFTHSPRDRDHERGDPVDEQEEDRLGQGRPRLASAHRRPAGHAHGLGLLQDARHRRRGHHPYVVIMICLPLQQVLFELWHSATDCRWVKLSKTQ